MGSCYFHVVQVCGDRILEKPKSVSEAAATIELLSGSSHRVLTGVCFVSFLPQDTTGGDAGGVPFSAITFPGASGSSPRPAWTSMHVESTVVDFAVIPPSVIAAYVATSDPYDKAGGYGVQSIGAQFVTGIRGDYYNVLGLPIYKVCQVVRDLVDRAGLKATPVT